MGAKTDLACLGHARKLPIRAFERVQSQPDLSEIIDAVDSPGGFSNLLHGWKSHADQDSDDRDDDQEFNQSKSELISLTFKAVVYICIHDFSVDLWIDMFDVRLIFGWRI